MGAEKLYKIGITGIQKNKTKVLDILQQEGFVHISPTEKIKNPFKLERDIPPRIINDIAESLLELRWMNENLNKFHSYDKNNLKFINKSPKELLSFVKQIKKELHSKLSYNINIIEKNKLKITNLKLKLEILSNVPFNIKKNKKIDYENEITFSSLVEKKILNKNSKENEKKALDLIFSQFKNKISIINKKNYYIIQGLTKDKQNIEKILKRFNFEFIKYPKLKQKKSKEISKIKKEIKILENKISKSLLILNKIAKKNQKRIVLLIFNLTIIHDRYEAASSFYKTKTTFFCEGFIPVKKFQDIKRIANNLKFHINIQKPKDAPTKLKNMFYVKHFEFITKMFGLPKYGKIDPTFYIAFFLPLFFGFMFSDVGYGILLFILGSFMIIKSNNYLKILEDAGIVLSFCAISTVLFGFLFGSFFGNLIYIKPLIFDAFKNSKIILIAGLGLGLLHLNLGQLLSIIESLKEHKFKDVILNNLSILSLEFGVVLLVVNFFNYSKIIGGALLFISIILFLIKSSLMGLMEVTGFLGTWFSYARLLALSLATGGIALGINIMASQLNQISLLGPLLFILLVILGHLFNFALNVLGSSIHSVRLHYIEFFSQFYEGGGTPFINFTTKRTKDSF